MPDTMAEKIPAFSDDQLASLLANAERLSGAGNTKQKAAANGLLPLLHAERSARAEALALAAAQRKRERPSSRRKKAVEPGAAAVEPDDSDDDED